MVSIQNEDIPVEELINGNFSSTTQQNNEILVSNLQTLTHTNENIRDETQLFMSQEKSSRTSILCSKQRISITVVAIILYMSISMATGVLLVYFNQPTKLTIINDPISEGNHQLMTPWYILT
ncbi:hypothetical protein I4U23_010794 [Adineta vaga]|nr:hypothetical protein I4U23_010794 [Adineta vaga]